MRTMGLRRSSHSRRRPSFRISALIATVAFGGVTAGYVLCGRHFTFPWTRQAGVEVHI
jgi:multidrug resistance efflux pump